MMMCERAFIEALRVLHTLTAPELIEAGVIAHGDGVAWQAFRSNPSRAVMRMDAATAARLWRMVETRLVW